MPRRKDFRALRKLEQFPALNPDPFDPRAKAFIAEGSIEDRHIRSVSTEKVQNIGIKVYRNTSAQEIADATDDDIDFNAVAFNQGFTEPTGTFNTVTVPRDGVYLIVSSIEWESSSTGGRNNRIKVNGSVVERNVYQAFGESANTVTAIRQLSEGDTVAVGVRQSSGGPLDIQNGEDDTSLTVFFLGQF